MVVTLDIPELRNLVIEALSLYFDEEDADLMADAVVFGELVGRRSHGIQRILPGSFGAADDHDGPTVSVTRVGQAAGRVHGSPGLLVAARATDLLVDIARENGAGVVTTSGSRSTSGSLTYYVERLARAGLVSVVCANTLSVVTARGAKQPFLGTNPMALGMPAVGHPFVADIATSAITGGEALAAIANGETLPPGVAVDPEGNPTVDPKLVFEGGALLPFGGHKGLGLSMFIELLCGSLAGSAAAPVASGGDWGHVFFGLSVDATGDGAEIRRRAQELIDQFREIPTSDGSPLRVPGERSFRLRDEALAQGTIDVDDSTYRRLIELIECGGIEDDD